MTKKTKNIATSSILLGSLLTTGAFGYSLYEFQNTNTIQNNSENAVRDNPLIEEKEANNDTKADQDAAGGRAIFTIMLVSLVIGGLIIANIMVLILYSNYGRRSRTFIEQNVNGKILKEEITVAIEEYKQRRDIVDKQVEDSKDSKIKKEKNLKDAKSSDEKIKDKDKDKSKDKKSDIDKVAKTKDVVKNDLGEEVTDLSDDKTTESELAAPSDETSTTKELKEKKSKKSKEKKSKNK